MVHEVRLLILGTRATVLVDVVKCPQTLSYKWDERRSTGCGHQSTIYTLDDELDPCIICTGITNSGLSVALSSTLTNVEGYVPSQPRTPAVPPCDERRVAPTGAGTGKRATACFLCYLSSSTLPSWDGARDGPHAQCLFRVNRTFVLKWDMVG